jgi:hypothetical protein
LFFVKQGLTSIHGSVPLHVLHLPLRSSRPCAAHLCVSQVKPWMRIFITRAVALVPALTVAVLTRHDEGSTALDQLNQ